MSYSGNKIKFGEFPSGTKVYYRTRYGTIIDENGIPLKEHGTIFNKDGSIFKPGEYFLPHDARVLPLDADSEAPGGLTPNVLRARVYTMTCIRDDYQAIMAERKEEAERLKNYPSMTVWDVKAEKERQLKRQRFQNALDTAILGPVFGSGGEMAHMLGVPEEVVSDFLRIGYNLSGAVTPGGSGRATPQMSRATQGRDGVTIFSRLRSSLDSRVKSKAPGANNKNNIGKNQETNEKLRNDIDYANSIEATDIRVNQQQVNASGQRVGINRPSLQYTTPNGQRVYIIYGDSSDRVNRILANDPGGRVIVR